MFELNSILLLILLIGDEWLKMEGNKQREENCGLPVANITPSSRRTVYKIEHLKVKTLDNKQLVCFQELSWCFAVLNF